ncbi:MAG: hypothetical protein ACTMK5_17270, partial [Pseudomonas helleri]
GSTVPERSGVALSFCRRRQNTTNSKFWLLVREGAFRLIKWVLNLWSAVIYICVFGNANHYWSVGASLSCDLLII